MRGGVAVAGILLACSSAIPLLAQESVSVWVNLRSGVYHCAGTEHAGRTARGEYLLETVARRRGFRPNGGRICGPLGPAEFDSAEAAGRRVAAPFADFPQDSLPIQPPDSLLRRCLVLQIEDGDTIECDGLGRVRLIGVDSPESDQEPFGTAATAGLAALLPAGVTVLVEPGVEERDQYRRLLGYLWRDGAMVNWTMVRFGWAVPLPWPPNTRYAASFATAERMARGEERGLWRVNGFRCRPQDHRARRC